MIFLDFEQRRLAKIQQFLHHAQLNVEDIKVIELQDIKKTDYQINSRFNDRQREAVQYDKDSNVVVIAGAGSGKTSIFVERLNYLIHNDIDENNILALTFTEKAANEFKSRSGLELEYFGTFHSVFYKLLQRTVYADFTILDEDSYEYYLRNTYNKYLFDTKEFIVKIGSAIDLDKFINKHLELIFECDNIDDFYELLNEKIVDKKHYTSENVVKKFFEYKQSDMKLSFSDIIIYTYFTVKEDTEFYLDKFSHIMVDEFQDSNKIVLEILAMMSKNNIFYVGDIYQSIYSFQGSSFKKTLEIIENSEIIQLDTNYRSSDNIVDFANKFVADRINEKSSVIKPVRSSGLVANKNIFVYENISDFTIPELIYKSKDELSEICILTRNNNHIKEIKQQLEKWNVPYNYKNYREFEYVLDGILLMLTTGYKLQDEYFDRFNFKNIADGDNITDYIRAIENIVNDVNLAGYFANRGENDLDDKLQRWEDKQLRVFASDVNLDVYLDTLKNRLEYFLVNKLYLEKVGVNVMTIHKAKGLEWNTVVLYNFEDGVFPRNIANEEEKRLYYVAITRAKENLIITSKHNVNSYTSKSLSYVDVKRITKQTKYELSFENSYVDNIDFIADCDDLKFSDFTLDEYKNAYKFNNREIIIEDTIRNYNAEKQSDVIKSINDVSIEDIELVLLDLEEFKQSNKLDNTELRELINSIDTDKKLFFNGDKIHSDYINNEFTDLVHHIINYKNWIEEELYDIRSEEREIKKFKKIVKNLVSKKYTNLVTDLAKKYIEKRADNIKNKHKNSKLNDYDDFVDNMIKSYHHKSNQQKEFFVSNVLGMYNNITNAPMIDLYDEKYDNMKRDVIADFEASMNGYSYRKEILKGNFLNQSKTIQAHKRWAKLKYLEHVHSDKRALFITFTLPSIWHNWKHKYKSLKEERKYGDGAILKENKNFVMQGNNLEEHFINSAKEVVNIWTYFYHILKIDIEHYRKAKNLDREFEVGFFRQSEAHKNLTAHGHFLIFVDEEVKSLVQFAYHKTITKFGLNKKFQDLQVIMKQEDINISEEEANKLFVELMSLQGMLDVETNLKKLKGIKNRIKKINKKLKNNFSSPATYIGKYMLKNAFRDEEDDKLNSQSLEFFNAWESMLGNKVKITGMSNYRHTTQKHIDIMYKWYQENAPEKLAAVKRTGKPLYWWLEKEEMNGNFTFEYERKIKENFKNSAFMKDVEFIYSMLKQDDLTSEVLQEKLDKLELDFDIKTLDFLLINRTETDIFLWELSANYVLENQKKENYINIYTDKKLVQVSVSEKLVYKYSKTSYTKAIESYQYKLNNPHLSFVPTEWGFKWHSHNGTWSLKDEVAYNLPKYDTLIYIEDMYSRGWITADEIAEATEWDIYTTMQEYNKKICNYSNYANNVDERERNSFKDDPLIFLAS